MDNNKVEQTKLELMYAIMKLRREITSYSNMIKAPERIKDFELIRQIKEVQNKLLIELALKENAYEIIQEYCKSKKNK